MSAEWLRAASLTGYGVSLAVGIGVPIPIIDESMARSVSVKDEEIFAQVVDYGMDYPQGKAQSLGQVSYAQLKTGAITLNNKKIPTAGFSSYYKAQQICEILKGKIVNKEFLLTEPVQLLPGEGSGVNPKGFIQKAIV
jgi:Uncharacterized conserved protein